VKLGKRDSDAHLKVPKTCGMPLPHSPSRAACRSRTRHLGGTGSALWPDELTRHGVPGAIRTHTAQRLMLVPPAVWATRTWSRHPVSNRASRLTKAGPQAVRGGKAAHRGFEPRIFRFRAGRCYQLELMGIGCGRRESNAQAASFEFARYSSSLHSRLVRREGLEPPNRQIKSLLLYQLS
jgi:hypothetical protein